MPSSLLPYVTGGSDGDGGPALAGALGGLVAGVAMGVVLHGALGLMPTIGALVGVVAVLVGWAVHLFNSALFGLFFAGVFDRAFFDDLRADVGCCLSPGVGHSALLVLVMIPLALAGRAGLAVATGWASHLALDAIHVVVNGRPTDALFLFWPVLTPPNPPAIPPGSFFWYYLGSRSFFLEVGIWVVFCVVLVRVGLAKRRASGSKQVSR